MDSWINKRSANSRKEVDLTTEEIVELKKKQIDDTNRELQEVHNQILEVEKKIREDDLKYKSEIDALIFQRDNSRKDYNEEISKIVNETNEATNKLKTQHKTELEYVYNELNTALFDTEEFISKSIGSGDLNDKQYRFTRAKKLSEKYASIVDSIDSAISKLITQRNQQIVNVAGQIEATNSKKNFQAQESHDTNKKFKQEITDIEKMHRERLDQISKKYESERRKLEDDINQQIAEIQTAESMYSNIATHNREKIKEVQKDIARIRILISKSSIVPKQEDEDEKRSRSLLEQVAAMESEINDLRNRNSQLKSFLE
ncbi:hypothetical protein TVAG_141930 [Trichomonas vaginalis G3]|uniref:Uncharacterized protein n=1 Tax=Trichomonas vaginalis (strain ATCC PRA-98 / G3) TaxID=412133 RepID=A2FWQ6_TRIV3|nr:hypothetical protein TVAGG3_0248730 [Trichomonas vaginalis G3]EAX90649.1 hypothetical protein TVAG_141930 [Trichomonas vaginalis G3]KAI5553837.1 hypothetical protein TVAGG3_0248730 [Trichomonas vaginalis G3]|eukprot:XP_001303579.1 hypothetical protein [Trichomonas vaginalis G3]